MMLHKASPLLPIKIFQAVLTVMLAGETALYAQTAGQVPANYKGPTLYGVCVYVVSDTSYYSSIFSTSGYFKFKAQEAFHAYATAQAKGAMLKGSACRWSTSQEEVSTQKDADKRLLGLAGRSAKGVETGWAFDASATNAAGTTVASLSTAATPNSPTKVPSSKPANPSSSANPATVNAQPSSTAQTATTGGSSTTGTLAQPAAPSTKQTVQDSVASSRAVATTAVNEAVATTMGTVTSGATNAMKNMFNRKPKTATDNPQNAVSTPSATGQSPAPLGMQNTESPLAATAEAQHIEGLVADVAGEDIIINVGVQAGVRPGTKLAVMHAVRTVKDPATGKILRTVEDKVGELTIKNSDATSAAGTFAGTKAAQVGDIVRSAP